MGTDPTANSTGVANAFWIGNSPTVGLFYITSTNVLARNIGIGSTSGLFIGRSGAQGAAGTNYDAIQLTNSTSAIPQPTSGTYNAVSIGVGLNQQFQPNSGNANYVGLSIRTTLFQSSGTTGNIWGIRYMPTISSPVTGRHIAFENVYDVSSWDNKWKNWYRYRYYNTIRFST